MKSLKTGFTKNWIFLPVAGYRYDDFFYNAGSCGYYWSSSLYTDHPIYAYRLYFYSGYMRTNDSRRYYGQSVRPVCDK